MDRNTKITFGLFAFASAFGMGFMYKHILFLEKMMLIHENHLDFIDKIQDVEYQKQIDEVFEDIADNYDE